MADAPEIREFQSIMPMRNIPSVMKHGILSHERVAQLNHSSVAMPEIQDRRDQVQVPGGLRLHQYANLYFHARNPMMYKRKEDARNLAVLKISTEARHIPGVVLADQNASTNWVRFLSINQVDLLDLEAIYARDWRHPNNEMAYRRHKAQKCAISRAASGAARVHSGCLRPERPVGSRIGSHGLCCSD